MTTTAVEAHAFHGLDACVHCGFCLPACPTYEVTSDEADSPRGRIVLMHALVRGELPPEDDGLALHLDRCLGCRACESVCPSGVVFGPALEATRARIALARPLPWALRAALWVLARPERQSLLWLVSRLLRRTGLPALLARGAGPDAPRAAAMLAMLAATKPDRRTGGRADGRSEDRDAACLFRGCVMDGLFGHVHAATIVALNANDIAVREVGGQVCCGALAAHSGAHDLAQRLACENVRAFANSDGPIVVNSAGCGALLKDYGHLLGDTAGARFGERVRDVTEALAAAGPRPGGALELEVVYDAPCHLQHAQRVHDAPLAVLGAIPGLRLRLLPGSDKCCGSAGIYSVLHPEMARSVLDAKIADIAAATPRPSIVTTGNPGCLMQIGAGLVAAGLDIQVAHPVELLDLSYKTGGVYG